MAQALDHRGPDGEGEFIDGPIGFYHKRLAIIDLVTGAQPMTVGPLTIVFNGEIYNYVELRADLIRRGHTFRTQVRYGSHPGDVRRLRARLREGR